MNGESDQWIIVGKPKRKQIKKQQKIDEKAKSLKIVYNVGKPLYLAENETIDEDEFINSEHFKQNSKLIKQRIAQKYDKNIITSIQIQCLGLGDFVKHFKPHYQYLFLKHLLVPLCSQFCQNLLTNCYDPVFTEACIEEVKKLKATCKPDNIPEEKPGRLIVLYMPHCQRFLYERYCERYKMKQVLVIGNSLKDYIGRCQLLSQKVPQSFANLSPKEFKLTDYKESFNDTFCYYI